MNRFSKFIQKNFPYLTLSPAIIILLMLTLFPVIYSVVLSFNELSIEVSQPTFIGFRNYIQMLTDDKDFWNGLRLTITYTFLAVSIEFILGFIIASLLNQKIRFIKVFRLFLILPLVITPVVAGLTWRILYSPSFGLINYFLSLLNIGPKSWLSQPQTALFAVVFVDVWQWTPFMFLMLYAGLQSLPNEPYEAAFVDGASSIQILRHITLPLLKNIIVLAMIFRTIDAFLSFDIIFILTKGGPGTATQTLNMYSFYTGFNWFNLGYTAAISTIMLVILVFIVWLITRIARTSLVGVD